LLELKATEKHKRLHSVAKYFFPLLGAVLGEVVFDQAPNDPGAGRSVLIGKLFHLPNDMSR